MTNDERSPNAQMARTRETHVGHSDFVIPSSLVISARMIATGQQLTELVAKLGPHDRIAIDTEADSRHCYKEKLYLLHISLPGHDAILNTLAHVDLAPIPTVY